MLKRRIKLVVGKLLGYKCVQVQDRGHKEIMYRTEESYRQGELVYLLTLHASSLEMRLQNLNKIFVKDKVLDSTYFKFRDI